jgi:hypothetical protein
MFLRGGDRARRIQFQPTRTATNRPCVIARLLCHPARMWLATIRVVRTSVLAIRNPIPVTIAVDTIWDSIAVAISTTCTSIMVWNRYNDASRQENSQRARQHDELLHMTSRTEAINPDSTTCPYCRSGQTSPLIDPGSRAGPRSIAFSRLQTIHAARRHTRSACYSRCLWRRYAPRRQWARFCLPCHG